MIILIIMSQSFVPGGPTFSTLHIHREDFALPTWVDHLDAG
jgi:hypothetical protein